MDRASKDFRYSFTVQGICAAIALILAIAA
jgi:hypothetical protein